MIGAVDAVARELMLLAAAGFLLVGADDLLVDVLWLAARVRARFAPDPLLADLPRPTEPMRFAIFVAAWREQRVIGPMLRTALERIDHPNYRIFVGAYPNDPETIAAVRTVAVHDARVRLIVGPRDGKTTKGDNLNVLWRALLADDARDGRATDAVVIHDAEDVIHPDELTLHEVMLIDAEVAQTPVVPIIHDDGRLVSGTYVDEFSESHGKSLLVRNEIGAGLPLAGVGCAIRMGALRRIAGVDQTPFDASSVVEDYELGLRLAEAGCSARFSRVRANDGSLIATRAYFPHEVEASRRQRARWITGIALSGWDRIGWSSRGAWFEHWMRMRDRRAPLAVLVLAVGYLAILAWTVALAAHAVSGIPAPVLGSAARFVLMFNGGLLIWRIAMRALHTTRQYGVLQGLLSFPRLFVANYISLLAVREAMKNYVVVLRGGEQHWEKTEHFFPDLSAEEPQ